MSNQNMTIDEIDNNNVSVITKFWNSVPSSIRSSSKICADKMKRCFKCIILLRMILSCFINEICCCPCMTIRSIDISKIKKKIKKTMKWCTSEDGMSCMGSSVFVVYGITFIIGGILIYILPLLPSYQMLMYDEIYELCGVYDARIIDITTYDKNINDTCNILFDIYVETEQGFSLYDGNYKIVTSGDTCLNFELGDLVELYQYCGEEIFVLTPTKECYYRGLVFNGFMGWLMIEIPLILIGWLPILFLIVAIAVAVIATTIVILVIMLLCMRMLYYTTQQILKKIKICCVDYYEDIIEKYSFSEDEIC